MMALRFRLFGFPVAVQPFFFLTAWLIGPKGDLQASLLWVLSVALGVLAHELGHAFAGRRLGLDPAILLHGFGGATSWRVRRPLGTTRKILLTAAGPAVGITVGVLALLVSRELQPAEATAAARLLAYTVWVNLGWGLLNLFPVLPLDGGHIAATLAEALFGRRGRFVALVLSLVFTGGLALWAIWQGQIWLTILAVILSVSNLQALGPTAGRRSPRPERAPAEPASADAVRSYDVARSMAASGRHEEALDWLETAVASGLANGAAIDADPAWAPLRGHPRFIAIRRAMG
jgi:Zn-dependent protease